MLTPENAHYRLPKGGRTRLIIAFVVVFTALVGLWLNAQGKAHRAETARGVAEQRANELDTTTSALQRRTAALLKANHRLLLHGQKPVGIPALPDPGVGPEGPQGRQGQTGQTGTEGPSPTRAEVFAAVAQFCSSGACTQGPSAAQVETAVSVYCAVRNQCRGATGSTGPVGSAGTPGVNGQPGQNGNDGQPGSPGADGQNATDAQVQSAVNTYCDNHNQCQGPQGQQGPQGAQGDPGPKGDPGSATPGTYTCPLLAPVMHGFTIAADGTVSLDCFDVLDHSGKD